jgi:hypothetical protein
VGTIPPSDTGATEEYDGTNWTSNPFKYSKSKSRRCGTQTAALGFGGRVYQMHTQMQQKNMTELLGQQILDSLNTARGYLAGAGTQTAGLAFGGTIPAQTAATEEYNGATWTTNPKFKYSKRLFWQEQVFKHQL